LIREGRVSVNGKVVTDLGTKIDPQRDKVRIGDKLLVHRQPKVYILLYKPRGCLTTMEEREKRATITQFLKGIKVRVFPVGRLDYNAEGLLLLTNDGEVAKILTHPRYGIPRRYLVKIRGIPSREKLDRLRRGIRLEDGYTLPARVKIRSITRKGNSWLDVVVREGRNRLIKRMFQHLGHPVQKIKRIQFAFLRLEGLLPGQYRYLTPDEVKRLQQLIREKARQYEST